MIKSFVRLVQTLKNKDGASLVEYALLIALVAAAAVAGLHALGGTLNVTGNQASSLIQSGNVNL